MATVRYLASRFQDLFHDAMCDRAFADTTKEAYVSLLIPDTKAPVRPSSAEIAASSETPHTEGELNLKYRVMYLKSYLLMRTIIGFVGITFPIVLIVGDHLLDSNAPFARTSLSAYYYSGMRDFFVGGLFTAGLFLITYKVFEKSLNNLLSIIAGVAAIGVALFPTDRFEGSTATLTPLQARIGEGIVADVHFTSAGVFMVSLAIISFFFGVQEGRRTPGQARMSPAFWRWFHWFCTVLILGAVLFVIESKRQHTSTTSHQVLIGETVALVAFGLSWFFKGLELNVLLGTGKAERQNAERVAVGARQ
jgi:hypothetical protein